MESKEYCHLLEWDTYFFHRRIARASITKLDKEIATAILRWCTENRIECLYFLGESTDIQTSLITKNQGFNFVDVRVTLNINIDKVEQQANTSFPIKIRSSRAEDISYLKDIAKDSFQLSRFYFDGNFSRQECDTLYQIWVEKSCQGDADTVLVAEFEERAAGFITCTLDSEDTGSIGLVGIDKNLRGKGMGRILVGSALAWFANHSIQDVRVVTQGRNVAALRLYENSGFLINSVQIWYHKWFT